MVRACVVCLLGFNVACSPPDSSGLFTPYEPVTCVPPDASASGGSEGFPDAAASSGGTSSGEGQGGSGLGVGGGSGGSDGAGVGGSATVQDDAGAPDAGEPPDAAPPPCVVAEEVCDGVDNDCDDDVDPDNTCPADCAGFSLSGHGYMYCADTLTRGQALAGCAAQSMHLVWLETPGESAALRELIVATGLPAPPGNAAILTQIGGSDAADEDAWSWVGNGDIAGSFQFWQGGAAISGGEAVGSAYAEWANGEPTSMPNENCAAMSVLGGGMQIAGQWDDRSCNEQLPYLCEVP